MSFGFRRGPSHSMTLVMVTSPIVIVYLIPGFRLARQSYAA